MAPAAVVSGRRISQDALKTELDVNLRNPQLAQQVKGPNGDRNRKDFTRRVLAFLIELELLDQYAETNKVTVSRTEIDQALQQTISGLGGEDAFKQELKLQRLTVGAVRRSLGRQLLFQKVQDSVAARAGLPSTASQDQKGQAFQKWLTDRLRSGNIDVNPRFGRLDPKTGQILPITSTAA